jgi:hypothetical protein
MSFSRCSELFIHTGLQQLMYHVELLKLVNPVCEHSDLELEMG